MSHDTDFRRIRNSDFYAIYFLAEEKVNKRWSRIWKPHVQTFHRGLSALPHLQFFEQHTHMMPDCMHRKIEGRSHFFVGHSIEH